MKNNKLSDKYNEIVIVPAESRVIYYYPESTYLNALAGRTVRKGEIITISITPFNADDISDIGKELLMNEFNDKINIKILDTKPTNEVRVNENTKITVLQEQHNIHGFPFSKTIKVEKIPDTRKLILVKSLEEMKKISKLCELVNCYEDKNQFIYFVGNYYFKIKK
ncbi:MAG: hypothetical protein KKB25_02765 [Nanoarchaeota archaeon]|nr:hypothetical protein [Nanoarchaeota archaeon]